MSQLLLKIRTAHLLGWRVVLFVVYYRFMLKTGLIALFFSKVNRLPKGVFFSDPNGHHQASEANGNIQKNIPDWHLNPLTMTRGDDKKPWWKLPDFDSELGDIKCIWEASRFDWVLLFAREYRQGQKRALTELNIWLSDWCEKNPGYYGVNWKCGQEVSIRIFHLAMASLLLGQDKASSALLLLLEQHVQRIVPTIRYAISQNNNHGTSEAAALFIAGSWLAKNGVSEGYRLEKKGRNWLENRIKHLIEEDGTFSQYSTNYHRVLLDTLCMVELWRRALNLPVFSLVFQKKAKAAVNWLYIMVDRKTGDAPNLGAHDGAKLFPLVACDSRDFRPTVQTAMVLFHEKRAYSEKGHWDDILNYFGISIPLVVSLPPHSQLFDQGGVAVLKNDRVTVVFRYPRFRFRPSQADLLHVDLWQDGLNVLRDAGSYGYHVEREWTQYFSGTLGHNTIMFDDRDQMPRLGQFLFGDWLKTKTLDYFPGSMVSVSYQDKHGCYHGRTVKLLDNKLIVIDQVNGFQRKAILRWRLCPGEWQLEGNTAICQKGVLSIKTNINIKKINLVNGWESRYYLKKDPVPVLEIEIDKPGELISEYEWTQ